MMKRLLFAILFTVSVASIGNAATAGGYECGTSRIGWTLDGDDGEIHTLYWATTDFTELYSKMKPDQPKFGETGVPQLMFVFSICFPGKVMPSSPPRAAELRIQVVRNFVAALVPDPVVAMTVDKGQRYELTGSDFRHWTEYPAGCGVGDTCVYSAVLIELPLEVLRRIAASGIVEGTISATPFELTPEHRRRLTVFISRITGG